MLEKAQAASLAAKQSQHEEQIAHVGVKSLQQFWLISMENLKNSFCWALDNARSLRQRSRPSAKTSRESLWWSSSCCLT